MIKIFCQRGTVITDITMFCTSIVISGSLQEVARKLECSLVYAVWDKHTANVQIDPGSKIWAILDRKEIFRGVVFDRGINSNEEMEITAFDYAIYLTKSKITKNFKKMTPEQATKQICSELGVSTGTIASTNMRMNRIIAQKTGYGSIMELYTQASKVTRKQYYLYMDGTKVCVGLKGSIIAKMVLKPCSNNLKGNGNMIDLDYKDSISEMINRVRIYNDKNNYIGMAQNTSNIKNYGILQDNYSKEEGRNANAVAKNMLKGITKQVAANVLGNWDYRTGNAIEVQVPFISTLKKIIMYVESDTQMWDVETDAYTTEISLKYDNLMDVQEE